MGRKFKALIYLFILLVTLLPISVEAAETSNVTDFLKYLSKSEVQELQNTIDKIESEYEIDTVIVITDDVDEKSSMDYADDFYDYNKYGLDSKKSGVLMLINMEDREVWISTKGKAIKAFSNSTIKSMVKDITREVSSKDYYDACTKFLEDVDYYCNKKLNSSSFLDSLANAYDPDSEVSSDFESSSDTTLNPETETNTNTEVEPETEVKPETDIKPEINAKPEIEMNQELTDDLDSTTISTTELDSPDPSYLTKVKNRITSLMPYILSLIISLIATLLATENSKWKVTVNSKTYEGSGSFNLTDKQDILVSENTTRTKIEKKSKENNDPKETDVSDSVSNNKITNTPQKKTKVKKVKKTTSRTHRSNSGSTHGGGGGSF